MNQNLLWLASYPKSGNTWVRTFLANLIVDRREPVDVNDLSDYIGPEYAHFFYENLARRPLAEMTDKEINGLRPTVQRFLSERHPDVHFVKTHSTLAVLDGISTISRDYTWGAVYLVRNPLDVAVSYAHHMGSPLATIVDLLEDPGARIPTTQYGVFQFLGTWSQHVRAWAGAQGLRKLVIRYEDLARDPVGSFASLCAFAGVPADAERLEKAIRFSGFDVLSEQETKAGFVERMNSESAFFRKGRVGSWREEMPPHLAARVVASHGTVMRQCGYLDDRGQPVF